MSAYEAGEGLGGTRVGNACVVWSNAAKKKDIHNDIPCIWYERLKLAQQVPLAPYSPRSRERGGRVGCERD